MFPCSGDSSVSGPPAPPPALRVPAARGGARARLRARAVERRRRGGAGRADDGHVEAPAGDLDGVGLLDRLGLVAGLDLHAGPAGRGRLEPRLVLDEVAAGLGVVPLARAQQRVVERDQGLQALDLVLRQRAEHPRRGLLAVGVPDDELAHHRVVHRRDLAAGTDARVDAHARARRLAVGADPPGRGGEVAGGVLGVDAALDRVAAQHDVLLRHGQRLAGRRADALLDDVDARRHLGHAVLDLDAGVHLQEEVLAVLEEALDRARAAVVDGARGVGGDLADPVAQCRRRRPGRATPR